MIKTLFSIVPRRQDSRSPGECSRFDSTGCFVVTLQSQESASVVSLSQDAPAEQQVR